MLSQLLNMIRHMRMSREPTVGPERSTQTHAQSSLRTLWAMGVRCHNRGHLRRKLWFLAAPVVGKSFLKPSHPSVRIWTSAGKIRPKNISAYGYASPTFLEIPGLNRQFNNKKGDWIPVRGTDGPVWGTDPPHNKNRGPFNCRKCL